MFKEFKKFILRGNAVDLAVGVVIGTAFSGVVAAIVNGFLQPLISIFQAHKDFAKLSFHVLGTNFPYGQFISAIITFVLTATAIFFFVVQPLNRLQAIANKDKETPEPTTRKCTFCFSEVQRKATRCPYCTSKLEAAAKLTEK